MIPPFVLSSDCLNKGRVYQASTDWHFPVAAAPTGDSITDSAPLGMDNPRLKSPDSVINDTSTGCDPCSLAVMPHVEPTELGELTGETCTIIHYHSKAAPWQSLTELDSTFISNKTCSAHTFLRKLELVEKVNSLHILCAQWALCCMHCIALYSRGWANTECTFLSSLCKGNLFLLSYLHCLHPCLHLPSVSWLYCLIIWAID